LGDRFALGALAAFVTLALAGSVSLALAIVAPFTLKQPHEAEDVTHRADNTAVLADPEWIALRADPTADGADTIGFGISGQPLGPLPIAAHVDEVLSAAEAGEEP
jgi:hypothetical protein